jgi:hypothetical protein
MRRKRSQIISIFGEIEMIVAQQMMIEGKGVGKLAPTSTVSLDDIPHSTRFNARGDKVRMVIVMPAEHYKEFERRIEDLRG